MKEKCDNICETCPMQTQIHCILIFSKATNASIGALDERIKAMEENIKPDSLNVLNPLEESEKLPAPEVGDKQIQMQL